MYRDPQCTQFHNVDNRTLYLNPQCTIFHSTLNSVCSWNVKQLSDVIIVAGWKDTIIILYYCVSDNKHSVFTVFHHKTLEKKITHWNIDFTCRPVP